LLFVCSSTRALHLEVVTSLDTSDFLMAYRRFVSKKAACPRIIRSDNAPTFKKAARIMSVDWRFQPPISPWWGGFFECFVKLVKRPLRKVLGTAMVTVTELETIVSEVERSVNSRPLTFLSDDPQDETPITPYHLMGKLPDYRVAEEMELDEEKMSRRMKYVSQLANHCRVRWEKEYLTTLLERSKKHSKSDTRQNAEVGMRVIMVMDHKVRAFWPVGTIVEVFPGKDGVIRSVKVKTGEDFFIRPIQKVIPLEMSLPEEPGDVIQSDEAEDDVNLADMEDQVVDPIVPVQEDELAEEDHMEVDLVDQTDETAEVPPEVTTRSGRRVRRREVLDI